MVRRYVLANYLDQFVTLTYRGSPPTHSAAVESMHELTRHVRHAAGARVPWLWVPEVGGISGRLHVHGFFAQSAFDSRTWRFGKCDVVQLDGIDDIRAAASYVAKGFDKAVPGFSRRYRLARGFMPEPPVVVGVDSISEGISYLTSQFGAPSRYSAGWWGASLHWSSDLSSEN